MAGLREYGDKVAVVTGASSGIGAELARQLAQRGMRVALVARRAERLETLHKEIAAAGGEARVQVCDVGERAQVESAARDVLQAWGRVDLLVNNAGFGQHVLFKDQDVESIERMIRVNYLGAVYWIKALLPALRERKAGWILNVSSFAGVLPQPDEAAYSASKHALTALSESLVYEFEPLGIHVLAVHPGLVRTEMIDAEALARLGPRAEKALLETPDFVAQVLRALERGEISVVIPRVYGLARPLRGLMPGLLGRALARYKLSRVAELER
jgi:short-subunit dehydrogenase